MSEKEELEHRKFVKHNSEPADQFKDHVSQYLDKNGYFPDSCLTENDIWPLRYCTKIYIDGVLYWKFV